MNALSALVSIIIPVYNGSNYLTKAIQSALNQSYQNIEIIIVNDGSNDAGATKRIVESFKDKIRYFEKENGGVSSALNLGIRNMNGAYFSWLSHDDEYLPYKISSQMDIIQKHDLGNNTVIYSDFQFINHKSQVIGKTVLNKIPSKERILPIFLSRINGCTLLIPKKLIRKVGFFNEDLKSVQDYDYWLRLSQYCDFYHQSQITISSREHMMQGCKTIIDNKLESSIFFIDTVKKLTASQKKELSNYSRNYLTMLFIQMEINNYKEAIAFLNPLISCNFKYIWLKLLDTSWRSMFSFGGLFTHPFYSLKLLFLKLPVYIKKRFY